MTPAESQADGSTLRAELLRRHLAWRVATPANDNRDSRDEPR